MSCFELEFACLIPKSKPEEETVDPPLVSYKGTEYKKTVRINFPSWKPIKSRLRRFWNWLGFVWFHSRSRKCRRLTLIFILTILLLFFMIVCVLLPLIFKCSNAFRQHVIFSPVVATHESLGEVIELHKNSDSKTLLKPDNFYVTVDGPRNSRLGAWSLTQYGNTDRYNRNQRSSSTDNYLLFFHDGYGNRRSYLPDYSRLLHLFNVIVFDYRAYGDSYVDDLNESGLVRDSVEVYKWLRAHVNGSIFLWGDNLGSAIAAHTAAVLSNQSIPACGVLLENPFTTLGEQLAYSWFIAQMNSYMPWYKSMFVSPLEESDLVFNTSKYLNEISSPVRFFVLEWTMHQARHFNQKISFYKDNHYDSFDPSAIAGYIQIYRYYKTDNYLDSELESFLWSFIDTGRKYCDRKH